MTRLLIVDDDVDLCRGLVDFLTDAGCDVVAANDAEEGLALLGKDGYDLIFLDIKLPGMSGIELLQKISNWPQKGRIYIMSGAPDAREQLDAGGVAHMASGLLRKPFDMNDLLRIVGCAAH